MQAVSKRSHEITPLNPPANAFSFKNGFPIINFQISSMPEIVIGSSMRLNATVRVRTNGDVVPNNFDALGTGERSGCMSNRAGAYSFIDQLTLSTQQGQTLEHIRHYGRYASNQMMMTRSQSDLDTNVGCTTLLSSRSSTTARGVNVDRSVSVPLVCGLNSQNYSLSKDGLDGMQLAIQLSPSSTALNGYYNAAGTYVNLTSAGWYYELADCTLSFDTIVPSSDIQASMQKPSSVEMDFPSISTIYSDIVSSDSTVNLLLNKMRVLSTQSTFMGTQQVNNYSYDSFAMPKIQTAIGTDASLIRASFLRGSSLYPPQDELELESESNEGRLQTELYEESISAFQPMETLESSTISNKTELGLTTVVDPIKGAVNPLVLPDSEPNFSISTSQDVYNVGLPFKDISYGLRVVSDLPGNFANSMFTYVKALNVLQKDSMGNVQIIS